MIIARTSPFSNHVPIRETQGELLKEWAAEDTSDGFVWQDAPHHILGVTDRSHLHTRCWASHENVWHEWLEGGAGNLPSLEYYQMRVGFPLRVPVAQRRREI